MERLRKELLSWYQRVNWRLRENAIELLRGKLRKQHIPCRLSARDTTIESPRRLKLHKSTRLRTKLLSS